MVPHTTLLGKMSQTGLGAAAEGDYPRSG